MAQSGKATCIECGNLIGEADDHTTLVGCAGERQTLVHRHGICQDFANFLAFNFKSGLTLEPGKALEVWGSIQKFYAQIDKRHIPNAYMRAAEIFEMIQRNAKRRKP